MWRPLPCLLTLACIACDDAADSTPPAVLTDAAMADASVLDAAIDASLNDALTPDATVIDDMLIDQDLIPDDGVPDADEQDQAVAMSEIDRVRASFGIMRTVAGRGEIGDKGDNGWNVAFEGGDAREAELSRPHIAMADAAGNIYIADKDAHAVRKVDPQGIITTLAGTSQAGDDGDAGVANQMRLNAPNGLWAQPDGTVFILDLGNRAVRRVDGQGRLTTVFRDPLGMGTGRGLWVSPDAGVIYYAAGSAVRRWTPNDGIETVMTGFASLGNLVVDPDGHLVVTDRSAHTVYRIVDGEKIAIAGNGTPDGGGDGQAALTTGLNEVRGVWFHPEGGFLVATHKGGDVWYVDTDGIIHRLIRGDDDRDTHAGDGELLDTPGKKLSEVRAVTMGPGGRMVVTENDRGFIRVVEGL
jgi:serine/threonine-protein kinase